MASNRDCLAGFLPRYANSRARCFSNRSAYASLDKSQLRFITRELNSRRASFCSAMASSWELWFHLTELHHHVRNKGDKHSQYSFRIARAEVSAHIIYANKAYY